MGLSVPVWLVLALNVLLVKIQTTETMPRSPNELKHCFKDQESCLATLKWNNFSCDRSCLCQGHFYGLCQYSTDVCERSRPWTCNCYGNWHGGTHSFCRQTPAVRKTKSSEPIRLLPWIEHKSIFWVSTCLTNALFTAAMARLVINPYNTSVLLKLRIMFQYPSKVVGYTFRIYQLYVYIYRNQSHKESRQGRCTQWTLYTGCRYSNIECTSWNASANTCRNVLCVIFHKSGCLT